MTMGSSPQRSRRDLPGAQAQLRVSLGAGGEDLRVARRAVADLVARCGAKVDVAEVVLLADELVSNAVRHAGGATEIEIAGSTDSLCVKVVDRSPALPAPGRPGSRDDRGRGLLLVEQLASAWGAEPLPTGGKTVWFEVHARDPAWPVNR